MNKAGQVTGYFEYDAFGRKIYEQETGPATRFHYQSNWIILKDSNGRFYLSPSRIYDANEGRFLQKDPLFRLLMTMKSGLYSNSILDPQPKMAFTLEKLVTNWRMGKAVKRHFQEINSYTEHFVASGVDPTGNIPVVIWVAGAIITVGTAFYGAGECINHIGAIRNNAIGNATDYMKQLYGADYEDKKHNSTVVGSIGNPLQHCIGACKANQDPGPCCLSWLVRNRIQAQEGANLSGQQDSRNNEVGFNQGGDCKKDCLTALKEGTLWCYDESGIGLIPCKVPGEYVGNM